MNQAEHMKICPTPGCNNKIPCPSNHYACQECRNKKRLDKR